MVYLLLALLAFDDPNLFHATDEVPKPIEVTSADEDFKLQVWTASWCGNCKPMKAEAQAVAQELGIPIEVYDYDQNRAYAVQAGITSVPYVNIVSGSLIYRRLPGGMRRADLNRTIRELRRQWRKSARTEYMTVPMLSVPSVNSQSPSTFHNVPVAPNPPAETSSFWRGMSWNDMKTAAESGHIIPRIIYWPNWGDIDLATYNRNCTCGMCRNIAYLQQFYNAQNQYQTDIEPDQQPCPFEVVENMLDLMKLDSNDTLIDLGCGDGRILIAAANRGIKSIGVDIDPKQVELTRLAITKAGVEHLASVEEGDARTFDLSSATAVTVYLYPTLLEELSPRLKSVKVGSPYHEIPGLSMVQHKDVWVSNSF